VETERNCNNQTRRRKWKLKSIHAENSPGKKARWTEICGQIQFQPLEISDAIHDEKLSKFELDHLGDTFKKLRESFFALESC